MWRDFSFEKFVRGVSEIYRKALKSKFWMKLHLIIQGVRKQVSFEDRKNEDTPKFPCIKIWYQAAFWRYLRIIWVIYNVFIK